MKTKKGFYLRNVCGEHIIVAEGKENIDFTNIISMNESSAYLWNEVQSKDCFDIDSLTDLLLQRYDIDHETAHKDAEELIKQWQTAGIIE